MLLQDLVMGSIYWLDRPALQKYIRELGNVHLHKPTLAIKGKYTGESNHNEEIGITYVEIIPLSITGKTIGKAYYINTNHIIRKVI